MKKENESNNSSDIARGMMETCPRCHGKGLVVDTGRKMRRLRTDAKLTQPMIAEQLGVTIVAVSQWEKGITRWTKERVERYTAAVEAAVKARDFRLWAEIQEHIGM